MVSTLYFSSFNRISIGATVAFLQGCSVGRGGTKCLRLLCIKFCVHSVHHLECITYIYVGRDGTCIMLSDFFTHLVAHVSLSNASSVCHTPTANDIVPSVCTWHQL